MNPAKGHHSSGEPGGHWVDRGRAPQALVGVGFCAQGGGPGAGYDRTPDSEDPRAAFIFDGIGRDETIGDFGLKLGGAAADELDRADPALGTPPGTLVVATTRGKHDDSYQRAVEEVEEMTARAGGTQSEHVRADMTYLETPGPRRGVQRRIYRLEREPQLQRLRQQRGQGHRQCAARSSSAAGAESRTMTRYLIYRLVHALIVVIGVTIIVFLLLHHLPGGPARAILGNKATPVSIAAFNREYGLDKPLPVQYLNYVGQLLHGNLGYSYKLNISVDSLIAVDLPKTLFLVGISFLIAVIIAVPIGIAQAIRRNRVLDHGLTGVSFLLYSMPSFWLALLLIDILSVRLRIFPAGGAAGHHAWRGPHRPARAGTARAYPGADQLRPVRPVHAGVRDREPGAGLHQGRTVQGHARA